MEILDAAKLKRLYDLATAFHVMSETPKDEAYFRGYLTGLRRRMTGGVGTNDLEAEAFTEMAASPDALPRQLGLGYKDGLAGVEIVAGHG
jgi:hypothetical protein